MKTGLVRWWIGAVLVVSLAAAGGAIAEEKARSGAEPLVVARVAPAADGAPACIADRAKGGDGAACSSDDECNSGKCEGGSCCTKQGAACDTTSHCCGYQACKDGTCP